MFYITASLKQDLASSSGQKTSVRGEPCLWNDALFNSPFHITNSPLFVKIAMQTKKITRIKY